MSDDLESADVGILKPADIVFGSVGDVRARDKLVKDIALSLQVGLVSGVVAAVYKKLIDFTLAIVWKKIYFQYTGEEYPALTTVALCILLGLAVGASMKILGEPTANLPGLVTHFWHENCILSCSMYRTVRIAIVSTISIAGCGSLGPEAPLVSMGAGAAVLIAKLNKIEQDKIITLSGMASGLAAFFGEPIAGAFFALEVVHRHGLEYYEALLPALASGTTCNAVFRLLLSLTGHAESSKPWPFSQAFLSAPPWICFAYGIPCGVLGGAVGGTWIIGLVKMRNVVQDSFGSALIFRGFIGGTLIGILAILAPSAAFWGELEVKALIEGSAKYLPHAPFGQLTFAGTILTDLSQPAGLVWSSFCKFTATLITVAFGYRGGYIFPLNHAGIGLGLGIAKILASFCDFIDPAAIAITLGCAVTIPATRCVFAIPLVMAALSDRPDLLAPALVASVISLVMTSHLAAIPAARSRY